jgi:CheY-like chemotaxis protein
VPRDIAKGIEAGFFRYLTKPIKIVEFMEALDIALHFAAQHGLGEEQEAKWMVAASLMSRSIARANHRAIADRSAHRI